MSGQTSSNPAQSASSRVGGQRSLLRRLLGAQETGLVLVIAVLMTVLTLCSRWVPSREQVELPEGTTAQVTADTITATLPDGGVQRFSVSSGWNLLPPATRSASAPVVQKGAERIVLPVGTEIRTIKIGERRTKNADGHESVADVEQIVAHLPSGEFRRFVIDEGWSTGSGERREYAAVIVKRTERVPVRAGQAVQPTESPSGWSVSDSGRPAATYLVDDGWNFVENSDSDRLFERDPVRNRFLNSDNLILVATVASFIAIIAVGMTGIIVLGGIDLSVGSIYGLALVVGATVLQSLHLGAWQGTASAGWLSPVLIIPLGVILCCAVGGFAGFINGSASVGLRVHPFIITLGGMAVYRGIAFVTTKGLSVGDLPPAYGQFVRAKVAGLNVVPTITMVVVGLVGTFIFLRTVFGRRIFAIGGNEVAAKYAGVPVGATKVATFTIAGMLAGLSASLALGYYGSGSSADGTGYELNVIAAAVVGGASLSGGRGSALGAILGAIIIQLIDNGFEVMDLPSNYRQIVIGLAIVLAVVVDQAKHRLMTARR